MWSLLSACVLSWGLGRPGWSPPGAVSGGPSYLGVIERNEEEEPPLVRIAFKRSAINDWVPAIDARDRDSIREAMAALPRRTKWQVCRDGRSLGTVVSGPRSMQVMSDKGTRSLPSPPSFVASARYDDKFETFAGRTTRPYVVSTLPRSCHLPVPVRPAASADTAQFAKLVFDEGGGAKLRQTRGWMAGRWTAVEVEFNDKRNTLLATVAFAFGDEIVLRVPNARVVDWISVDGDDVPDVLLWTPGYNQDGYVIVYGAFSKQAAFSWSYH